MRKRITGLDLRDDGYCVIEMTQDRKGPLIRNFTAGYWESPDIKGKSLELREAFAQKGIKKNKVVVTIPLSLGYWCHFDLPCLSGEALEKAVLTSLEEQVPWYPGNTIYGFQVTKEGEKFLIDAFAFPEETVTSRMQLLNNTGIDPEYFVPRPYGVLNYFLFYPDYLADDQVAVCIDYTSLETEITLFDKNGLVWPRSFPNPVETEGRYDTAALARELRLIQLRLRSEGKSLSRCYLSGWAPGLNPDHLNEAAVGNLGVAESAIGFLPPRGLISAAGREGSRYPGVLSAVGVALEGLGYGAGVRIYPENTHTRYKKTVLSRVAVTTGLLLLLGGLYFQYDIYRSKNLYVTEKEKIKQTTVEKISKYKDLWDNRSCCLEFFKEWVKTAPEGTELTSLVMEGNVVKELTGYTPSFVTLYERLISSSYLKELRIRGGITKHGENLEAFRLSGVVGRGN